MPEIVIAVVAGLVVFWIGLKLLRLAVRLVFTLALGAAAVAAYLAYTATG